MALTGCFSCRDASSGRCGTGTVGIPRKPLHEAGFKEERAGDRLWAASVKADLRPRRSIRYFWAVRSHSLQARTLSVLVAKADLHNTPNSQSRSALRRPGQISLPSLWRRGSEKRFLPTRIRRTRLVECLHSAHSAWVDYPRWAGAATFFGRVQSSVKSSRRSVTPRRRYWPRDTRSGMVSNNGAATLVEIMMV